MFSAALSGFILGGSLIIAIGAQNAYILRMGLLRHHVFWLCLFCAVSDAVLDHAGGGRSGRNRSGPAAVYLTAIALFGAVFLFAYALIAARRAMKPEVLKAADADRAFTGIGHCRLRRVSPGSIPMSISIRSFWSGRFRRNMSAMRRIYFAGLARSSLPSSGFSALAMAPAYSSRCLPNPRAWQILDGLIAMVMALLGFSLLKSII